MSSSPKAPLPPELAEVQPPVQLRMSKVVSYVMYGWVMIGVVALALRTFLLLFSANTTAPFVSFVLRVSDDYLRPFRGIFPPRQVGDNGYLDIAALFAIFIYMVLAWLVSALISYVQAKIDANDQEQRRKLYYLQSQAAKKDATAAPTGAAVQARRGYAKREADRR